MEQISNDVDTKAIRAALHLSVEALARRLEVSEKTIRRWEHGENKMQPRLRYRLNEFVKMEKPTLEWI